MRLPKESEEQLLPNQNRRGVFRRMFGWLFSQRHFHFKLLSGTAVGVLVIVFLAGIFLYVTIRNHQQEKSPACTTVELIPAQDGVVENDIAALETGHRENSFSPVIALSLIPPF